LPADESVATLKGPIAKAKSPQKTTQRPNVLVLCGRNKKRSRTAETVFKNDTRFGIRSAGLSAKSDRKVTENDLRWADLVLIMEHKQRGKLLSLFPGLELPPVEVLQVADEYTYMEPALVDILTEKINWQLKIQFEL
jgi:protein-tyrosine phosphatase